MTIQRVDYSINGLKLEGTIEYTNTTTVETIPQWSKKLQMENLLIWQEECIPTPEYTH
jgi:hypothetical protein